MTSTGLVCVILTLAVESKLAAARALFGDQTNSRTGGISFLQPKQSVVTGGDHNGNKDLWSDSRFDLDKQQMQLQQQTRQDLELFLENYPDVDPTLVFLGDSTMKDFSRALKHVLGGQAHVTERSFAHSVVEKREKALAVLSEKSCKHGPAFQTYVISEIVAGRNLTVHTFGLTECFETCLSSAVGTLQPTVVMWNFGLHMLHQFPHVECAGKASRFSSCGNYAELVQSSAYMLMPKTTKLVWRTTNYVCDTKLHTPLRNYISEWNNPTKRQSMEAECQSICGSLQGWSCSDSLLSTHGSLMQRGDSVNILSRASSSILFLDSFDMTQEKCDDTEDGIHYPSLEPQEVAAFAALLAHDRGGVHPPNEK